MCILSLRSTTSDYVYDLLIVCTSFHESSRLSVLVCVTLARGRVQTAPGPTGARARRAARRRVMRSKV